MTASLGAGVTGSVLFVITFLLDGATRRGYSPVRQPVSALALGSRGPVQTANFIICGLLIAASTPGLWMATGSPWLAVAVGVLGLALVASGVFPMDAMRGYPPGTPDTTPESYSTTHHLHDWAGTVVFVSLPAAAVLAALTLPGTTRTVISSAVATLLAVLFVCSATRGRPTPRGPGSSNAS